MSGGINFSNVIRGCKYQSGGYWGSRCRFLLKKNKGEGEEDGWNADGTTAVPTPPVTSESPSSPSHLEGAAAQVPAAHTSPASPTESVAAPAPASGTNPLPVGRGLDRDGEGAGPSGLSWHPSASSSAASFTPFSGGGQRLGGGRTLSSASSASSLSALPSTGASPKAKKAKSSHGSSTKVRTPSSSCLHGGPGVSCVSFSSAASGSCQGARGRGSDSGPPGGLCPLTSCFLPFCVGWWRYEKQGGPSVSLVSVSGTRGEKQGTASRSFNVIHHSMNSCFWTVT